MNGVRAAGAIRYVLLALACLGVIFLFLLATASANTALFARNYDLLLVLNGAMVVLLMGLVAYQLLRLRRNLKAGVFGSRLAARLVLLFALVAVLPGALGLGVKGMAAVNVALVAVWIALAVAIGRRHDQMTVAPAVRRA